MWDITIVGGGAAGLAAAVFAAEALGDGSRVLLLEKAPRVGRKLLATGNGTCNITNIHAACTAYHGHDAAFVRAALAAFSPDDAMRFFHRIGVCCTARENGRVYPLCEQASAVLDSLRAEAAAHGVTTRCDAAVTAIRRTADGFALTADEPMRSKTVLIAAGGAAAPSLGGGTDGYTLLESLGHRRTPLFPAIVQLKTDTSLLRAVKGIRVDAAIALLRDGRVAAAHSGEILFTEYGLSGPAVMQISREAADWERQKRGRFTAELNLLPDWDTDALLAELRHRRALAGRTLEDVLTGLLHKRVGQTVLRAAGVTPLSRAADSLTDRELAAIAAVLQRWEIRVEGTRGFGGAQVTAGGIATADFDPATMRSRLVPGLYAAGEVLDIDGDCGGYNLQWAWSSAHAAATAMAKEVA